MLTPGRQTGTAAAALLSHAYVPSQGPRDCGDDQTAGMIAGRPGRGRPHLQALQHREANGLKGVAEERPQARQKVGEIVPAVRAARHRQQPPAEGQMGRVTTG